ncbi:Radical SAM superfamily enzyme, MoaA/NifB/PqqE/SkfB family [Nocardia amikacinitolerans]|uniref:Radical SAM superfamily enzyme, MoaA/NifB/PqqE/SkfB family n=1 Tax=Nocardia amikacinitolerans TaxID=756689 RepID=A0A285KWF0_9NOCA|nr:radical SAM protein [Nocardia amikacinitolerans]SNY76984.1 Radical SAM superfamily enzyme, MoaA/NifB/PqqE/SkfB family [Nocardia amikacinitolerans]
MTTATPHEEAQQLLYCDDGLAVLVTEALEYAPADPAMRAALACHLAAPHTPAAVLAANSGVDLAAVMQVYHLARTSPPVRRLVGSSYYPHRLRWEFAAATVAEWQRRPDIPRRILAREPVLAETMEIHPTRGTCNYRCRMCLWSDQSELTYATRQLDTGGLMTAADWCRVIGELADAGVRRLVVSGGGEALINSDLPAILDHAADLGFEIHVYTTGFSIRPGGALFAALLRCHRIRFSIHSPDPATYDRVAGTRPRQRALDRVSDNLAALLHERGDLPAVGIGMVIQPDNYTQAGAMADFAETLGADRLDLRKDEVDVTAGLDPAGLAVVRAQLRALRARPWIQTRIDIGDELVALANGVTPDRSRTQECRGRWFRPTIGAFGHLTPCDLKAEPRFAATGYDLGNVKRSRILDVVATTAGRPIADDCAQCMPSSRTGNAIVGKLLDDLQAGVGLAEQPFD